MSAADGNVPGAVLFDDTPDDAVAPPRGKRHLPVVAQGGRVRPLTLSMRRQSKRELERLRVKYPDEAIEGHEYPQERGDCLPGGCNEVRPCPYAMCRHHLYLDVNERNGNIKLNFPDREIWELDETCALDVADRGGITLEEVAAVMNLTRERIRQLEDLSLARLKALEEVAAMLDLESTTSRPAAPVFDDGSGARTSREAFDGLGEFCYGQFSSLQNGGHHEQA